MLNEYLTEKEQNLDFIVAIRHVESADLLGDDVSMFICELLLTYLPTSKVFNFIALLITKCSCSSFLI